VVNHLIFLPGIGPRPGPLSCRSPWLQPPCWLR
jgi:hypothetical protein